MTEKRYLIVLSGYNDLTVKLVNEDVWNWIFSAYDNSLANGDYGYAEKIPESVLNEAQIYDDYPFSAECNETDEDGYFRVSCGSYENDRALSAPGPSFWSMKDAMKYIAENDIEIIAEWEGHIY